MPLRLFKNVGYVAIVVLATVVGMIYFRYGINSDLLSYHAHRFQFDHPLANDRWYNLHHGCN